MRSFTFGLGCVVLSLMTAGLARAAQVDLVAGPMVGHVTDTSARVWMQFPIAGEVAITVFDAQRNQAVSGVKVGLEGPSPFICDVPLNNLEPDHTYRIEVKFEDAPVALPGPALVIRTAPPPGNSTVFSIAFGSDIGIGAAPGPGQETPGSPAANAPALSIFKPIAALNPRAFLFLGNSGYLPAKLDAFPTTRRLAFRAICDLHEAVRQEPGLQELFRTTPCYAIYNDRDFGTLNADSSFVFAPESLVAFQRFWPNPDWGTPEAPGCYSTFTYGDVDFFLIESRVIRAPALADATQPASPILFGPAQIEWLEKNLQQSHATFKVLAAPCALFNEDGDSWVRYPAEQRAFLTWLRENRITGLVALAGNRPMGELLHADPRQTGLSYPVFTVGTSTLTDVPKPLENAPAGAANKPAAANLDRAGEAVLQNNFGTLDFGGQGQHRFVTLQVHEESGKVRAEQTLFAGQLRAN